MSEKELGSDEDLIAAIKAKRNYHAAQATRYEAMLTAYGIVPNKTVSFSENGHAPSTSTVKVSRKYARKQTFETIIDALMKQENRPKTTVMLLEDYNKKTKKNLDRKNFSSRLSILSTKTGIIKNVEYPEATNDTRFWWGLKGWIENGKFKPEYAKQVDINEKKSKVGALNF